jgi:hypothetical protein
MWIRIQLLTLMRIWILIFNEDPDPGLKNNPDPNLKPWVTYRTGEKDADEREI